MGRWRSILAVLCIALACGCGDSGRVTVPTENTNLHTLCQLYYQFLVDHKSRPPWDENEFKRYIKTLGKNVLDGYGISDVDAVFVSSRDGKPFSVYYGSRTGPTAPGSLLVIAYEQEGLDGRRQVAFHRGVVVELDQSTFDEMFAGNDGA